MLNNSIELNVSSWLNIYDSSTNILTSNIKDILDSMINQFSEPRCNLNYSLNVGFINFYIDASRQDKSVFYSWIDHLKTNYKYYNQFVSQGIVNVKLDNENNKIIIGNRTLLVSDLPDNIDATKIANGSITNEEFQTLNGINTNITIQEQINNIIAGKKSFKYVQETPATYWLITHNMNCIPIVAVYDSNGEEILATIITLDNNTLAIKFSKAYSGSCIISA